MSSLAFNNLLNKYGLLCHTFSFNNLPRQIRVEFDNENQAHYRNHYLSLIANAGPQFWNELKADQTKTCTNVQNIDEAAANPVDNFSIKVTQQLLQVTNLADGAEILYPGTAPAPLIKLGELASWSKPSPLGLGLHSTFGPWFAYRALVKTTHPLPTQLNEDHSTPSPNTSPCLTCALTPCVEACPGDAVSLKNKFNVGRCSTHRVQEQSNCKEQCLARNACPVGLEYQFSEEQRAYHMTHALQALISWAAKNSNAP